MLLRLQLYGYARAMYKKILFNSVFSKYITGYNFLNAYMNSRG